MTINAGTQLGRYEIRQQLGAGGMGEVFLAEDTKLERKVALKVLPAEVAQNAERMRRFIQEARAAAALNHPNIAHIYEIGETDGVNFIAMEFIEGETLREKIHRDKVDLRTLLKYLAQVADGLAKAHAIGIVHRDLKPDNIMVTRDGYAKILDFGLAKLIEPQKPQQSANDDELNEAATAMMPQPLSTPGMIMGTVGYMSPEQAQGRKAIDQRSDIFSFGCILYEAATGRQPFGGDSIVETLHKIIHAPAPPIRDFKPDAPLELQRIVRRCLAKDPEERYQTIKDVAIELKELRREMKSEAELHYSAIPPTQSVSKASDLNASPSLSSGAEQAAETKESMAARSTSSAEYFVNEIKRHKLGAAIAIVFLAFIIAGIAYGLYKFAGHKPAANLQSMKITRLTNSSRVGNASISPDGKYVAYSSLDESGQSSLWVRHVATTSNVQIVPPAGLDVIFGWATFSPDGNYIYYIRTEKNAPGVLYQVPVLGGTSKKLLENVDRISFSPDGKRFTFTRRYASQGEDALMVANADGTGEQKLATRAFPDFFLGSAAWSPDGKTIACPFGGFTGGYYRSVVVIQVADGTQKQLTSHRWNQVERVAWLSDGSGVITTTQEQSGSPYQIWQISYPDGEAHPITNDLNSYRNASLTADSSILVTVLSDTTSNVWVAPMGEWTGARQLTSGKENGGLSGTTTWTPDGKIIYLSRAGGNPDIWIMDSDGHNQKQLTDDAFYKRSLSVTPDNRYIVFDSLRSGTPQIWRVDIDGGNLKQLTTGIGAFQPHYSPDGKWVAYSSFGTSGYIIWRISIDGGEPVQVTNKFALLPAVSPDGKLIACYFLDQQARVTKIALLPFEGGDPVKLFDLPQTADRGHAVRWTPDGRALTYINTRGIVSNIWLQPIDGSPPKQLTDFKTDRIFSFDWSRDGKWLAISRGVIDSDVVLISNFR
jgi:serine/threonine protein kinase